MFTPDEVDGDVLVSQQPISIITKMSLQVEDVEAL